MWLHSNRKRRLHNNCFKQTTWNTTRIHVTILIWHIGIRIESIQIVNITILTDSNLETFSNQNCQILYSTQNSSILRPEEVFEILTFSCPKTVVGFEKCYVMLKKKTTNSYTIINGFKGDVYLHRRFLISSLFSRGGVAASS